VIPPPLPTSDCTSLDVNCPTDGEPFSAFLCEPPSSSSPSPSPSPPRYPPLLPIGAPERRPQVKLCVIPHSEEIIADEQALDLFLVAMIGGNKLPVAAEELRRWVNAHFEVPESSVIIRRYYPKDFLITFFYYDDFVRVPHDHPQPGANLTFVFKRWRRQLSALVEQLCFRVKVVLCGIPAHAWSLSSAQRILAPACSKLKASPQTIAKVDLCCFVISAWCIHPYLIPCEKIIFIPEPDVAHVHDPPLFLQPEELIDTQLPTLRHHVLIRILKIEDWRVVPDSSSD
jgi:hypothetical protein